MRRSLIVSLVIALAVTLSIFQIGLMYVFLADVDDESPEGRLSIGFMQRVDSLNPYLGSTEAAHVYFGLVYDSLTSVGEDLQPISNLAREVYPIPSNQLAEGVPYGSVWQYNLYQSIYWSDGEPFTADDVVFNVNLNAGNYTLMWAFQPYSHFMKWAEKIDDFTVQITYFDRTNGTLMPCSYAYLLTFPILPKHKLQVSSPPLTPPLDWDGPNSGLNLTDPTVCTGPFMGTATLREDFENGTRITLVRNPASHWITNHGSSAHISELRLQFYDDSTAMGLALQNGVLDAASFPQGAFSMLKDMIEAEELTDAVAIDTPKITQHWTDIAFSMVPTEDPDLNNARLDKSVRHALHLATNKAHIVDQFYLGLAEEGTTIIPPSNIFWHYRLSEEERVEVNLNAARALLEASGYRDTNGDGIRECTSDSWVVKEGYEPAGRSLHFEMDVRREHPEEREIAMYLQDQWRSIGVDLHYNVYDEVTLNVKAYSWCYDAMIRSWSGGIDPNFQLFVLSARAIDGWSDNHWQNESYEENYTLSVSTLDPVERRIHVHNCQIIHYYDCPCIPLAYLNQTWIYRTTKFEGWGDWVSDPERSIDNYWGGNPLYFDLRLVDYH